LNMRACILNIELILFCMFWPIHFSFRIRHCLWDTLSKWLYNSLITIVNKFLLGVIPQCCEYPQCCDAWSCRRNTVISCNAQLNCWRFAYNQILFSVRLQAAVSPMDLFQDRWCQQFKKIVGGHSRLSHSDSWQPCTLATSRSMQKCWVSHITLCYYLMTLTHSL
jgi:hypothetical protein